MIDVAPADRHLVLLVRGEGEKSKFLCGHDERHWFVAAIPEGARGVTGVETAKAALQPPVGRAPRVSGFRASIASIAGRPSSCARASGSSCPNRTCWAEETVILRNEPLARAGGTPHVLREAFRRGGRTVYVSGARVLDVDAYQRLTPKDRRGRTWRAMTRDPELFARGTVRHPDHATITLKGWHRVVMNTEKRASAMRHVAFLD